MIDKNTERKHIQYLKDEKFIKWMLYPTEELISYWQHFTEKHPEENIHLLKAKELFRRINLSTYTLSEEKKQKAVEQLVESLQAYHRKRKMLKLFVTVASTAASILLLFLFLHDRYREYDSHPDIPKDYYVGSELESKEILLFTGDQTTTFAENIDVSIRNDQCIQVKKENSSDTDEITTDRSSINRLVVPHGKRSKVLLPDGTQIWLNAGSTLIFPSYFEKKSREVKLLGEMYANVAHDPERPFLVKTAYLDVKVHGTGFNLSAYQDVSPWIVLVEGSVEIKSDKGKEMKLVPNERVVRNENGSLERSRVNVSSYVSWKDGYLTYHETPISEVLRQIERYYNLSFNLDDHVSLQGMTCSGKIILSDNLDNVLTALTLISDTRYHRENKSIYIYRK
ncbi:FecR family protein [Proteiniphilum sp. UBA1028]|jgi:hypothetical protein|uniref:FecR family protein n=1 Tax=Proteiniphilum sp. UBA1028 TaxID=1947251 RepID=UPI000E854087|nr:FecR domain-containing protein [Proteiniphilum sp. UBA1028]HBG57966.1 iron dicitrate transport regulator FecR [Porphyromonadaceae bacterium]